jgi:hypothetical protein
VNGPRNVAVGDLVLQKESRLEKPKWIGVIYDIKYDRYGTGSAFLMWAPEDPPRYRKEYGYSCTNIHNVRSEFDVVKK